MTRYMQNNDCGCNNPCPPEPCACPVLLSSDCVNNVTEDLECSGIQAGQTLTEVLVQLDTFICEKFNQLVVFFTLLNVGTGAEVYKGVNGVGNKLIRKINKVGNLITVTQNPDDISISIDETALDTFIENNQLTTVGKQLDSSVNSKNIYKDTTVVGDVSTLNFRSLLHSVQNGFGESPIRDLQQNADNITLRSKKINSSTLTITATDEEITLDFPKSAQIPALYVNDLYKPTYNDWVNGGGNLTSNPTFLYRGEGTLSKPFTNSRNYTSTTAFTDVGNSSVQNALDGHPTLSYVSPALGGTRLNPNRVGEQIIVQKNNGGYIFEGDLNYSNLKLLLEGDLVCTATGYLVDMDNTSYFDPDNSFFTIDIKQDRILYLMDSLGFRNSGNTSLAPPPYTSGRIGIFNGDGMIYSPYNGGDILNRYIFTGDGNNNDDGLHFQVQCRVIADSQGVYLTKNKMRIDFNNLIQSGTLLGIGDVNLKAFHMTGGQVRFFEKGAISLGNETIGRTYGITFEPQGVGIGYCVFQLNSAIVSGTTHYCFAKLNNENVDFTAFNSPSGNGFSTTIPGTGTVTNGLFLNLGASIWTGVSMKNCVFSYTGIDFTQVDLTQGNQVSTINFIGNQVVETLLTAPSRLQAIANGIPLYSAYLKTGNVAYPNTAGWVRDIVLPA